MGFTQYKQWKQAQENSNIRPFICLMVFVSTIEPNMRKFSFYCAVRLNEPYVSFKGQ